MKGSAGRILFNGTPRTINLRPLRTSLTALSSSPVPVVSDGLCLALCNLNGFASAH